MQEQLDASDVRKIVAGGYVPKKPVKQPCPDRIEIELPLPPLDTRPNARGHWAKKHKATQKQREAAATAAAIVLRNVTPPRWKSATVEATFHRPHKNARRADGDNLIGWLKATFDGLQDAGVIANDVGLIHLPPKQLLYGETSEAKVLLVVSAS